MPDSPAKRIGHSDIARAAGVSRQAVSYALGNRPGVSEATRRRIREIARQLGYAPDAEANAWLSRVRASRQRGTLPLAWINHHRRERDAWHTHRFLTPYLEGATQRARELGYHLAEFWDHEPGMTQDRLSRILYERGIEGVILTLHIKRDRLRWEHFAAVALDGQLIAPGLPQILSDLDHNLSLAFKMLRRRGYERIGICLDRVLAGPVHFTLGPLINHLLASLPETVRIPPCYYNWTTVAQRPGGKRAVLRWMMRYRPQVVIGFNNHLVKWAREIGFDVPGEMGVVHLATDDDCADWAGVCSNRRLVGATAVDWVVGRLANRDYGLPTHAPKVLIRGQWQDGVTLRDHA